MNENSDPGTAKALEIEKRARKVEKDITYQYEIHSVSDILEIVSNPQKYLERILGPTNNTSTAPLGRNHHGAPHPFPVGLWFRGHADRDWICEPSVFRRVTKDKNLCFLDEREIFNDIRIRSSNVDLRGYNNLELMCLMQHHYLPTRLLDWTESPLVAAFFATAKPYYDIVPSEGSMTTKNDSAIYVINAYKLNSLTNLSLHSDSTIFDPRDADVVIRSLMAEHTYIQNIASKISHTDYISSDASYRYLTQKLDDLILEIGKISGSHSVRDWYKEIKNSTKNKELRNFINRLSSPVAVIPRRDHARMTAQLSCFTMHGGKSLYSDYYGSRYDNKAEKDGSVSQNGREWHYIPPSRQLYDLENPENFMIKFIISKHANSRIMIELDRLGINESMIYQDLENQSKYVAKRWQMITDREKIIWPLTRINYNLDNRKRRSSLNSKNYMKRLYDDRK